MEHFNKKAKKFIKNMIIATMPKINVKSDKCRYNFRCQMNAVHEALNKNQDKIAMCFYLDGDYPIIHFINVNDKGEYVDNTLGRWSETFDYYLIRLIDKDSFFKINDVFSAYRKELRLKLPWCVRNLSDCEF